MRESYWFRCGSVETTRSRSGTQVEVQGDGIYLSVEYDCFHLTPGAWYELTIQEKPELNSSQKFLDDQRPLAGPQGRER